MAGNIILEMEFSSTTPLWPGGPLGGTTYKCFNGHCIGPFFPDSKQLIGRLRWLLRTVEASIKLLEGKPVRSYKDVESLTSRIFGSTSSASKVIIRLEFTPASHASLDYFNPRRVSQPPRGIDVVGVLEVEGYQLLRQMLGINQPPQLSGKILHKYNRARGWLSNRNNRDALRDLYLLLTIPRIRLALQGARGLYDIYSRIPLKPYITARVSVLKRIGAGLSPSEAGLLALVIPYLMAFIGLGKATTRGFGRFKLTSIKSLPEYNEAHQCLELIKRLNPGTLKDVFVECGCAIINAAAEALGSSVKCDDTTLEDYKISIDEKGEELVVEGSVEKLQNTPVPTLLTALALADQYYIKELYHPCPYATPELTQANLPGCISNKKPVKDVIPALSAVGKSTLKVVWKRLHYANRKIGSVKTPGPGYHTWALGLPRSVQNQKRNEFTGYYTIASSALYEYCGRFPPRLEDLRRLSPAIVTTICDKSSCSALLEAFISVTDYEDRITSMAHVGRHKAIYHVANVKYIALNNTLGRAHNCPRDYAGIALPKYRPGQRIARQDIALISQIAALNWVKELLS